MRRPTRVSSRLRPEGHGARRDEDELPCRPGAGAPIWSTSAEMRVVSGRPSSRVSTLLPILTTMRRYFFDSQFIIHNSKLLRRTNWFGCLAPLRHCEERGDAAIRSKVVTSQRVQRIPLGPSALPRNDNQFSPFASGFIFISTPLTVTMRSSPIFWRSLRMCTSIVRSPYDDLRAPRSWRRSPSRGISFPGDEWSRSSSGTPCAGG